MKGSVPSESLARLVGKWKGAIPTKDTASSIQVRYYELYNTPLADYSIDDLRFMIIQACGLEYLLPKAYGLLKDNIMTEGNYYPGDLLKSVLLVSADFWQKNDGLLKMFIELAAEQAEIVKGSIDPRVEGNRDLLRAFNKFMNADKGR